MAPLRVSEAMLDTPINELRQEYYACTPGELAEKRLRGTPKSIPSDTDQGRRTVEKSQSARQRQLPQASTSLLIRVRCRLLAQIASLHDP